MARFWLTIGSLRVRFWFVSGSDRAHEKEMNGLQDRLRASVWLPRRPQKTLCFPTCRSADSRSGWRDHWPISATVVGQWRFAFALARPDASSSIFQRFGASAQSDRSSPTAHGLELLLSAFNQCNHQAELASEQDAAFRQ